MQANPYYDPDWAHKYQASLELAAKYQQVCDVIATQSGFGSPRHRRALAQLQEQRDAAETAKRGQHPTLAAYAASRFEVLNLAYTPDFEAFTSLEQLHAALDHAEAGRAENPLHTEVSLPMGQPDGLDAFGPGSAVITSPRRFEAAELGHTQGVAADEVLDCIVSVDQLGAQIHFCIAHRWGALSPHSRDQFRNIATILARQAIIYATAGAEAVFTAPHATPDQRELVRNINAQAGKFVFYRHVLPRRELKEQFGRVDMVWNGTRFIDPDFSARLYAALPEALRRAVERGLV